MPPLGLSIAHISPLAAGTPGLHLDTPARPCAGPDNRPYSPAPGPDAARWNALPWTPDENDPVEGVAPPPEPRLSVPRHGELMKLRGGNIDGGQRGGGKRGQVRGMSRQARGRLMELIASVDRRVDPRLWLFLTLTYPAEYPHDPTVYKRHLDTFFKRLYRLDNHAAAIWKLEYQRRGAPHYHVLLCGRTFLDHRWLRRAWFEVVGSADDNHLVAGTQVDSIQTWHGVTHYAAKYVAKSDVPGDVVHTGRVWGVHNRACLPIEGNDLPLLWAEFHQLRRLMRRYSRGAKLMPWHSCPLAAHKSYTIRSRDAGQGARLFVAEAVAIRLLRGLGPTWQLTPGDAGFTHKSSFRRWSESLPG